MRSRIDPMKKLARTLRDKRESILNWFQVEGTVSSGTVEGFHNKLKLITRKSYGFRTQNGAVASPTRDTLIAVNRKSALMVPRRVPSIRD